MGLSIYMNKSYLFTRQYIENHPELKSDFSFKQKPEWLSGGEMSLNSYGRIDYLGDENWVEFTDSAYSTHAKYVLDYSYNRDAVFSDVITYKWMQHDRFMYSETVKCGVEQVFNRLWEWQKHEMIPKWLELPVGHHAYYHMLLEFGDFILWHDVYDGLQMCVLCLPIASKIISCSKSNEEGWLYEY